MNIQPTKKAVGYIGFKDNKPWAIQFNDCTEYEFQGAEKYLWFDRQFTSISCYQFKPSDPSEIKNRAIEVYESPSLDSTKKTPLKFEELNLSPSGWGSFPRVYNMAGQNWFKVKEGWVQLTPMDKQFVQFYKGEQDESEKSAHDYYFYNH